ncbi:MAG: endolytic transglycosylase MltG [bacterium]
MAVEKAAPRFRRVRYAIYAVAYACALAAFIFWLYVKGAPAHPDRSGTARIVVSQGASAWRVGFLLRDAGLIRSPRRFAWHLKVRGESEKLKAGVYDIPRSASMKEMGRKILNGEEVIVEITFPEGWTAAQMAGLLQKEGVVDSTSFIRAIRDEKLIHNLSLDLTTLEGFLYPETYIFRLRRTPLDVISSMVTVFRERVGDDWMRRAQQDPLGLQGIVTLASIVQGEYQVAGETPDIAALYRNRLKQGMLLQADPTVQYILPEGPRRLTLRDLKIKNPYNTYVYSGLPPGPIDNPGIDALRAALEPPDRPWLYMVARGDGRHTFTTTFEDHLRAKKRLDAIRRQEARRKLQGSNS